MAEHANINIIYTPNFMV